MDGTNLVYVTNDYLGTVVLKHGLAPFLRWSFCVFFHGRWWIESDVCAIEDSGQFLERLKLRSYFSVGITRESLSLGNKIAA